MLLLQCLHVVQGTQRLASKRGFLGDSAIVLCESNSQMLCTAGGLGGDLLRLLPHSIFKFHTLNDFGDSLGTA